MRHNLPFSSPNPMAGLLDLVGSCSGGIVTNIWDKAPTQLISDDGIFKEKDFEDFLKSVKLRESGGSHAVVAIMGPQSSGKSTLLNQLFDTKFQRMNSREGRNQCTRGVWIAKAPDMEPPTMVLDLEGADGVERGQDDTAFERQIAVFALAVADVLIINMWCHDLGRQRGGSRDLLKEIFEAMLCLFDSHALTLLFVIRDKTTTPANILKRDLGKNVEEIWKTVVKPQGREDITLSEIFKVEIAILSNYESATYMFEKEVGNLKWRYFESISPKSRQNEVIPFKSAKKIWDMIKGCKDLHLPSHKVMVATVKCEDIAKEKLSLFESSKEWLSLQQAAATKLVPGFSTRISSILDKYLAEYDGECIRFEKDVRQAKREFLISEAFKVVRPAYMNTLQRRRLVASREFETQLKAALSEEGSGFADSVRTCQECCVLQFNEQCCSDDKSFSNDVSTVRDELLRDIETIWQLVQAHKLPQITEQIREGIFARFNKELSYILMELGDKDIWSSIRNVVKSEIDAAALALPPAVAKFELEQPTIDEMVCELKRAATESMAKKFKEQTQDVPNLLKQRFITALYEIDSELSDEQVDQSKPTVEDAYPKCVKLLSTVAVIRLDETADDHVESELHSALMAADEISPDTLAYSDTWEKVSPEMTLITPAKCRVIWNQFKVDMEQLHANAKYVEDQCDEVKHERPSTWVIMGLLALGLDLFMDLLRICRIDCTLALGLVASGLIKLVEGMGIDIRDPAQVSKMLKELRQQAKDCGTGFKKLIKQLKKVLKRFWEFMKSLLARKEATMVSA